ncbi:HAD family phosphatase [Clostridium sp. SM-530-WT-3G]|uniref:HAD family hydrolase n=1 Tax=Clostridium sp. SM-530-WT-3G TaxID=2725303 RepID=UPI00145F42DC|nr:HAD family phosphatase [Clostridium sp. SM-530-WT-3G]NME83441.1 HAD family phosphatase [Clostridium sp. SM-530-WT-3G]
MKSIKGIIFDMDGILIDTERISFNSYKKVFEDYDYEINEEFYLKLIGHNVKSIKEIMINEYGKDFPFDEIYEHKVKLSIDTIKRDGLIVKKGVQELVDYLKKNNYKIAVATSTGRERAHSHLNEIGILGKIDYVICGDQVANSKPDPEIFLKAAKGIDLSEEECIVIEDSEAGIRAAHNAGIKSINVPDMIRPNDVIKQLSYKICNNLLEVKSMFESK